MVGATVSILERPKDLVPYRCQDAGLGPEGAASAPRDTSEERGGGGGRTRARLGAGASNSP